MSKYPWQTEATRNCARWPGAKTVKRDSQSITDNLNEHPENKANDMQYSIIQFIYILHICIYIYITYMYIYIYTEPVYPLAKLSLRAMERDIFCISIYLSIYLSVYGNLYLRIYIYAYVQYTYVYIQNKWPHDVWKVLAWILYKSWKRPLYWPNVLFHLLSSLHPRCWIEIGWVIWYFVAIQWKMYQTNHVHCIFVH
jgi:hypothetical protein